MKMQTRASWTMLSLVVLIATAGAGAVWWQDRAVGRLIDAHALDGVRALQGFAEQAKRGELELKAGILASSPEFVGYVSQALAVTAETGGVVDAASIRDLLEERRRRYGFDVAAVLDSRGGSVVMQGEALRTRQDFSSTALFAQVRKTSSATIELIGHDGHLVLVSLSPMLRGDTVQAYLLAGNDLGRGYIEPVARAGQVEVAMVSIAASGNSVVASTLDATDNVAILDALAARQTASAESGADSATDHRFQIELDEGRTIAATAPLFGTVQSGVLVAIVPVAQRVVGSDAIRTPMLVAGALVLVVMLILWLLIRQRTLRPLGHLVELSERVLRGDIQMIARDFGSKELAMIAAAFNQALAGLRGYKEAIEKRGTKY